MEASIAQFATIRVATLRLLIRVITLVNSRSDRTELATPAQKARGDPLPIAPRLRLDHGALVALLVPSPTAPIVAAIRAILKAHNPIEEDPGGVYDQCETLAGAEADQILRQLQNHPEVRVLPHVDNPFVMETARRAVARAGYDLEV